MSIIYKKNHLGFLLAIALFFFVFLQPQFASAAVGEADKSLIDQSPISRGLCNVFELASGNIGKAVAIFAIVAVGFGFFTGKFSIALVIGITLGIGILFGSPKIIAAITGGSAVDCSTIGNGEAVICPQTIQLGNPYIVAPSTSVTAPLISFPSSLTVNPSTPSNTLYTISVPGGGELVTFACELLGTTATWKVTQNVFSATVTELPFTIGSSAAITVQPAPFISNSLTAGTPAQLQFVPAKFCPPLTAQLEIKATSCSNGFVQIGTDSKNGTANKVCVNAGGTDNPAITVSPVITTAIASNTDYFAYNGGAQLVISRPGFDSATAGADTALTATIAGRTFTATCITGGTRGAWKITESTESVTTETISGSTVIRFR